MRINLTKKDLVNVIYMQVGFSKQITENLVEEFFSIIVSNLCKKKSVKISKFGTFLIRSKILELAEIQKLKKKKRFLREMLFYLNHQKNLKNYLIIIKRMQPNNT